MPIRVLVADDEALIRHALRVFVGSDARMTLIGEATDGNGAITQCEQQRPDVVVMDIHMPGMNGIDATSAIVRRYPEVKVLALTTFSSDRYVVAALRAGASGYLVKDTVPDDLVTAIVDAHEGRSALSPQISHSLIAAVRGTLDDAETGEDELVSVPALTDRELSIVQLLARGSSNAEIARTLSLSEATIKANFTRIMTKWDVRDRVQVLIRATQANYVSL